MVLDWAIWGTNLQGHPFRFNGLGTSDLKYFAHYKHNEEGRFVASTDVIW